MMDPAERLKRDLAALRHAVLIALKEPKERGLGASCQRSSETA